MTVNLTEIEDLYVGLLILQYKGKPKAEATIRHNVRMLLNNGILFNIRDAFNIDTAIGHQLDILGKYVGINRNYARQLFDNTIFFSYKDINVPYTLNAGGYFDIENNTGGSNLLNGAMLAGVNNKLYDDTYRFIMKLKIIQNNSNLSLMQIDEALKRFYKGDIYVDTTNNMDITYNVQVKYRMDFKVAVQKRAVPIPSGRKLTVNYFI